MSARLQSAGPVTPRPWWRRALTAFGAAVLVQLLATAALYRTLPTPWNREVPGVLGIAVLFTYRADWWRPRWRRAALAQFVALVALGLAVVGLGARLGWWR